MIDCLVNEAGDGDIVLHRRVVVGHRPAVAVAGVFAETQIGDADHADLRPLHFAEQPADDVVLIQRRGPRRIFAVAVDHAEDQVGGKTFLGPFGQPRNRHIHRHLKHARHRSLAHENGNDDVAPAKRHPLEHLPKLGSAPQPARANGKIDRVVHCQNYSGLSGVGMPPNARSEFRM